MGAALLETLDTGLPLLKKEVAEYGVSCSTSILACTQIVVFCTGVTGSWGREGTRAWIGACETTEGTPEVWHSRALCWVSKAVASVKLSEFTVILQRTRAVLHGAFDLSWLLASEEECRLSLLLFLECATANVCNRRTGPGAVAFCCSFFTCLFWLCHVPRPTSSPGSLTSWLDNCDCILLHGEATPTRYQRLAPVAPRKAGLRIPAVALARAWCRVPYTWR